MVAQQGLLYVGYIDSLKRDHNDGWTDGQTNELGHPYLPFQFNVP